MTNFEGFKDRKHYRGIFHVPSAAMRSGDFSGSRRTDFIDPCQLPGRTAQFPGNIIPSNRIHPTSVKFLEFYPAPNVAGTDRTQLPECSQSV